MASLQRMVVGCLGLGFAALCSLVGCAEPGAGSALPGELELRVDSGASYGVIGRFHLLGTEPGVADRDIDFDAATPSLRVALRPGAYTLTLHAGARLVCRDEGGAISGEGTASERLVSTWPQHITIASGELTTARIGFGSAPTLARPLALSAAPAADPCASATSAESAAQALLSR